MKLHNTLTGEKELFTPLDPQHVRFYVCGPTVYDKAHLGNARPYTVFDVLFRWLNRHFPKVTYVRNITDIDDKIIKAAHDQGIEIGALTAKTTETFQNHMAALNNLSPTLEPRATDHIPHMIALIEALMEKGHAYEREGHVLFKVSSFSAYGALSRLKRGDILAGARVEVAPYKEDGADFVLWKPSPSPLPGWDSPWGFGRPGWHIECSAMAETHLGLPFDIHGGGQDLIFPHHENEIAQSCCARDISSFATLWVHNGMLRVNGQKMSKSLGNFLTVDDLLHQAPGEVIRYALLSTHYRQVLDWTPQTVAQAKATLNRLYGALRGRDPRPPLEEDLAPLEKALEDDLNTPLALSFLHDVTNILHKEESSEGKNKWAGVLKEAGSRLGLLQQDADMWFQGEDNERISALVAARQEARQRKDFAESDRIRNLLLSEGIVLEDTPQGPQWRRE